MTKQRLDKMDRRRENIRRVLVDAARSAIEAKRQEMKWQLDVHIAHKEEMSGLISQDFFTDYKAQIQELEDAKKLWDEVAGWALGRL